MRKRGGRKRALGSRAPMTVPQAANQCWSLDFASDVLDDGRRFRVLVIVDDFGRECLALVADSSLSGRRVARELDHIVELRGRPLESLSGGQQRRCWFGMALAQEAPVMLLDEPTTFLDPAAQIALLDLVRELNHHLGRTIVMVLHDLNLAARYADRLVVLHRGQVAASGPPREVVTADLIRSVFDVEVDVILDPRTGAPLCVPLPARRARASPDRPAPPGAVLVGTSGSSDGVERGGLHRGEIPGMILDA